MKICHLTSVHPRYDIRIFPKECVSLQKAGYDVSLVVADGKEDEIKNSIKIYGVPKSTNRLKRMLQATKHVYCKAVEIDADIYHLHDPELIPIGVKLKKKGKIIIFDSHEDVPTQIACKTSKDYLPFFLRRIISYLYAIYERKTIRKFDAIITVSPHIVERLKSINNNTVMVTNYPIVNSIVENTAIPQKAICFAGLVSPQWSHIAILSALSLVGDVKYNLAGPVEQKYLQKLEKMPAWNHVNFVGKIPADEVFNFIRTSAVGMALSDYYVPGFKNVGSMGNTKIFEYMRAGVPVICSDAEPWRQIMNEEKCGIYVDIRNEKDIANAIETILSNPEMAKKMGVAGQKAVKEKYNWATQEKVLLDLYKSLINLKY